jgi:regulator of protease activity HflC (stomatin/prohibitin superfamily)
MTTKVFEVPSSGTTGRALRLLLIVLGIFIFLGFFNPVVVIPAGHVGVRDLFGMVSDGVMGPGVHLIFPMTRVIKMSIQTQEMKETADVPSQEGLTMSLEASLLYRLDPTAAPRLYKTVGRDYASIVIDPQIRSAIREVTASYDAKALYSSQRDKLAHEILDQFTRLTAQRGIVAEAVLLRKIGLPEVVANAIQEKLRREQEAEQMKFVLQKEQQEAERKRIEAQGVADFQRIVASGISQQLLEWKGIEATEKLALSPNTKIVVVGNPKTGLPIILGGEAAR